MKIKINRIISLFLVIATLGILMDAYAPGTASAAGTVEIYVISEKDTPDGRNFNYTQELSYNKKGLLVSHKYGDICTITFKYNKKNLLKSARTDIAAGATETYKYINKDGKRRKVVHIASGGSEVTTDYIYHIKGYLIQAGDRKYRWENGVMTQAMMYDNAFSQWINLTYDDHGNLTLDPYNGTTTIENTYEEDRLVLQKLIYPVDPDNPREPGEINYRYKKITVKKSMVKIIKQQQWSLMNDDMDAYFNISVGWG